MQIAKQLSIFLKNRPGTLADVCSSMTDEGINILGFSVSDTVDHAVVRMVVDEPFKAIHLLGNAGLLVVENDILLVELRNEPGQLASLSRKLGAGGINIEYAYGGVSGAHETGVLFVRTSDVRRSFDILSAD